MSWRRASLGALVLLALGVWPLFLLPSPSSSAALVLFLPFLFGVGLPLSASFLGLAMRDSLFVPLSIVSGIILAGEAHLVLLHVRAGWLTPVLVVAGGAFSLARYRRRVAWALPAVGLLEAVALVVVLRPFLHLQYRSWRSLVDGTGEVVNFFNTTQVINVVFLRDVGHGLPMHSSFIYPLVGTYHVGGHALVDLVRRLGGLTVFEANFIVGNLFGVLLAEVALLWLISRWFCTRFWTKLLFVAVVIYLPGAAGRVLPLTRGLVPAAWAFGNDHTEIFAMPYVSTNVARMASVLLALWLVAVTVERVRRRGDLGRWGALGLGLVLGSMYYYKNAAFFVLVPGFALAALDRAWRFRKLDLAAMLAPAIALGAALHLSMFAYGGTLRLGAPFQVLKSFGPPGASLAVSTLVYLAGWNVRAAGALVALAGWRSLARAPGLALLVLVLVGSYGAGFFVGDFLRHYDDTVQGDGEAAPAAGGEELSVHNVNLGQFIHVPHALLSVVLVGFLLRWIEADGSLRGTRRVVAGLLIVAAIGGMTTVRKTFPFAPRPGLAEPDLRAALTAIPTEGTLTAANFTRLSAVALRGHHFYDQKADYFNYRALRAAADARAAQQSRLFSPHVGAAEAQALLAAMGVTHLLMDRTTGALAVAGCEVYYENEHYRVCQVGAPGQR